MSTTVITLEEKDLVELQAILLDHDEAAALRFLESRIAGRLSQRPTALCDSTRHNPFLVRTSRKKREQ